MGCNERKAEIFEKNIDKRINSGIFNRWKFPVKFPLIVRFEEGRENLKLQKSTYIKGMRDGIPIMLGYLAVSFSFGILARKSGLATGEAVLMSALNVTSAGQFAALDIIANGDSYLVLALSQLVINLRYSLMSCSLSQKLPHATLLQRCAIGFGNTDEVFALSAAYQGETPPEYCYGLISSAVPGWVLGTLLGAVAGGILPQRVLNALGVMLYGMFVAIVLPPCKGQKKLLGVVIASALMSVAFSLLPILKEISASFRVIILTVGISALAAWLFPVKEENQ